MADKRLSQLADAGTLLATDSMLVVRSGTNYQAAVGNISALNGNLDIGGNLTATNVAATGNLTAGDESTNIIRTWTDGSNYFIEQIRTSGAFMPMVVKSVNNSAGVLFDVTAGVRHRLNATGFSMPANSGILWTASATNGNTTNDTGIFRIGAGQLAIGNAAVGDTSGNLTLGNLTVTGNVTTDLNVDGNLVVAGAATIPATQTIWMPAPAMTARTSNGATAGSTETSTNKVMVETYDFGNTSAEYVQFSVAFPKGWDLGNVTAEFYWTASGSGNVTWGLQGVAISNDDPLDAAFGNAQTVNHTLTANLDLQHTSATGNITIAGTPVAGDLTYFQLYRDPGTDTLAANASLIGVKLLYTVTTIVDV